MAPNRRSRAPPKHKPILPVALPLVPPPALLPLAPTGTILPSAQPIPLSPILKGLRLADLVELCQGHQLDHQGRKADLIARLDTARDQPQHTLQNNNLAALVEQLVPAILSRISAPEPPPQPIPSNTPPPAPNMPPTGPSLPYSLPHSVSNPPFEPPTHFPISNGEFPPTPPPVSFQSDTSLRRGYVPPDLLDSLLVGHYQVIAEWITSALITHNATRKGKSSESTRNPEGDLSSTLWIEAMLNLQGALRSLALHTSGSLPPIDSATLSTHADQIHAHMGFVVQCINEHYNWPALQRFDREVRSLKAAIGDIDIGNPDAVFRTFQRLVGPPSPPTARTTSIRKLDFIPTTKFSATSLLCFRCGAGGHSSTACSQPPLPRPTFAQQPNEPINSDGAAASVCRAFNGRGCARESCHRAHVCLFCYEQSHKCSACPSRRR